MGNTLIGVILWAGCMLAMCYTAVVIVRIAADAVVRTWGCG